MIGSGAGPIRRDIGDFSREIAAFAPIALVNNSKHGVCNAQPASTPKRLLRPRQWIARFRCSRPVFLPVPVFNAA
jgi:hypothetical protein